MLRHLIALALLFLFAAPSGLAETVLHRGNLLEPESLDPHKATGLPAAMIFYDLYEGLLTRGQDGLPRPGLADHWDVGRDGLTMTFYLRQGLRWSDGSPITARDVVYTFRRLADPAQDGRQSNLVWMLKYGRSITGGRVTDPRLLGVEAVDDLTVRFTLEQPYPFFPALLGYPMLGILPEAPLTALGKDFFKPGNLVSSGAYKLAEWVPGRHVKLVRNPFYREDAHTRIDSVYFHVSGNEEAELQRYRAGELDVTFNLAPGGLAWARTEAAAAVRETPLLGAYGYYFNMTREPWRSSQPLRQALSMVLDRQALIDGALNGLSAPSVSFVPASVHGPYVPARPHWADWPLKRRIAAAQHLLTQAGYPGGRGLTVDMMYSAAESNARLARAMAEMWKTSLGVDTRLTELPWKDYLAARQGKSYPGLIRGGTVGAYDDPNAFLELLRSEMGTGNPAGYANRAYDALMAAANRENDPMRRLALLARADQMITDDAVAIPLHIGRRYRLVSPRVQGWVVNNVEANPTRFLSMTAQLAEKRP